jgi:hypothetical protein
MGTSLYHLFLPGDPNFEDSEKVQVGAWAYNPHDPIKNQVPSMGSKEATSQNEWNNILCNCVCVCVKKRSETSNLGFEQMWGNNVSFQAASHLLIEFPWLPADNVSTKSCPHEKTQKASLMGIRKSHASSLGMQMEQGVILASSTFCWLRQRGWESSCLLGFCMWEHVCSMWEQNPSWSSVCRQRMYGYPT